MHSTLIEPETLAHHLEDPGWCIVDCRAALLDHSAGRRDYDAGHIPGAHHADLENTLSGPRIEGVSGRHPLPDRTRLRESFGRWGITPSTQLVAYDADTGMFAARLWWLARWLGHGDAAVLDGGLAAWQSAERPIATEQPADGDGRYPERAPLTRVVDANELLAEEPNRVLLDARSPDRFAGRNETIDPIAGHIAGARNAPFTDNLGPDGRFLSGAQLEARFDDLTTGAHDIVCYCGSGVSAAHTIIALRIAGFDEPALYPGSWSEWIQDPSRPRQP